MNGIVRITSKSLRRDLEDLAYVVGDVARSGVDAHTLHQTFDIGSEDNRRRVEWLLDLGWEEARAALGSRYECRRGRGAYSLEGPGAGLAGALVREFLLCRTLGRWLEVSLPVASPPWREQAESLLGRLPGLGRGAVRRRLSPF